MRDRYGRHYRVECTRSPLEARAILEQLAAADDDVALVLAGQWLDGMTGSELLGEARRLHPHAKRALLIAWGEWGIPATGAAIFDAIAQGRIDHYVIRPSSPADELFHNAISGMLLEWAESQRTSPHTIHIVGESWSGRAYELRELLGRCAMPHAFSLADSSVGRALVDDAGDDGTFPLVILPDGTVLRDPTNAEIVRGDGFTGRPAEHRVRPRDHRRGPRRPVGRGVRRLRRLQHAGRRPGWARRPGDVELADPQLPRLLAGRERSPALAERVRAGVGLRRALHVPATRHRTHRDDDGLAVNLSDTGEIARAPCCSRPARPTGALGVPELESLNGAGVFYGGTASEASSMADRRVFVVGGANSAGQAALHLTRYAEHVTLVVRAESLAAGMSQYLVRQVEATPKLDVRVGTEVVGGGGRRTARTSGARAPRAASEETVDADALFLMIGARPHTEWLPPEIRARRGRLRPHRLRSSARAPGRSTAHRCRSRRACPASSRPATFATAR